MNTIDTEKEWTSIVSSRSSLFNMSIVELWRYRDLIILFIRRDFIAIYKQTILGPIWFLLQPLFSTIIFTIIFGRVAKISTEGVPHVLFYMSGIIIWNYFSSCLIKNSNTFISNANIFSKVYFPRLTVPISVVMTNIITFLIQFALFLILLMYFYFKGASIKPNIWILITPLLILQMSLLGIGMGILISSLTTKYRDLAYLMSFGVQLWMYATPIVYPLSEIPEKWRCIFIINPMAAIVETFRYGFLGSGSIELWHNGVSLSITLVILIFGLVIFSRIEKTFMDTV